MASDDFAEQAEHTLDRLEQALDACGLDYERKEGGIIEIELADGARVIVNRHAAAREIWVAARAGGFHYRWDGAAWRDTRDGSELFSVLSRLVGAVLKA